MSGVNVGDRESSAVPGGSPVASAGHERRASIAVVMPAYNEADRIEQTLASIARYFGEHDVDWPIVLADDGSTDGTVERATTAARRLELPLRLLTFEHRGKAATVRDAMLAVAAETEVDYLMMLDADDELPISQLDHISWSADARTIYIGRRVAETHGSQGVMPTPLRRLMSGTMRLASRVLLGLTYPDTQCGFKLFPRDYARALFGRQWTTGWVFDAELLAIATRVLRLPVQEVEVTWQPRGESKVGASAMLVSGLAMLGVGVRFRLGLYDRPRRPKPARSRLSST